MMIMNVIIMIAISDFAIRQKFEYNVKIFMENNYDFCFYAYIYLKLIILYIYI